MAKCLGQALLTNEELSLDVLNEQTKNYGLDSFIIKNIDGKKLSEYDFDQFKKELFPTIKGKYDILAYWSDFGYFNYDDEIAFEKQLNELKKAVQICNLLKIKNVIINGIYINDVNFKEVLFEKYRTIARTLDKLGCNVLIYVDKDTCNSNAGEMLEIINAAPGIKVYFDPVKHTKNNELAMVAYRYLKNYIHMIVLDDIDSFGNKTIIGSGEIGLLSLFRVLQKDKYNGYFVIDPVISYYSKRDSYYKRSRIPLYNLIVFKNDLYRSIRKIDKLLKKKKNEPCLLEEITKIQILAMKKLLEK